MLSINKWELDLPRVLIFEPNSSPYLEVELIAFNVLYSVEGYKLTPLETRDISHKTRRYRRDISMSQPFPNLAKLSDERFGYDAHSMSWTFPTNAIPLASFTDKMVAISYLAYHPHWQQVLCIVLCSYSLPWIHGP